MKKRIISVFIIFLIIFSIILPISNASFSSDFLKYYLYGIDSEGDYNIDIPRIIQEDSSSSLNLESVSYDNNVYTRWLIGTADLILIINEDVSVDEMVDFYKNNIDIVNSAIEVLGIASNWTDFDYEHRKDSSGNSLDVEMSETIKKEVSNLIDSNIISIKLDNGTQIYLKDKVKDRSGFNLYIDKAHQKMKTVASRINGIIEGSYKEFFQYNKEQIKDFLYNYGKNFDVYLKNDYEKKYIEKCWKIKLGLDDNDKLATRTNVFVQVTDGYETKLGYDLEQIRIFVDLFGSNPQCANDEMNRNVKSEWAYVLSHSGKHSNLYTQCTLQGHSISEYSNKNGDKTGLINYSIDKEISDSEFEEYAKGEIGRRQDTSYSGTKYTIPIGKQTTTDDNGVDVIIDSGNAFVDNEANKQISDENIKNISNIIFNILLIVGIIIAVLVGSIIGIKFMVGSVEEKAEVKKLLVPYIIGCVVVFGAFTIWKIAVTIIGQI